MVVIKRVRKFCTKCQRSKPVGEFNKHHDMLDGHQKWCRRCHHNYEKKRQVKRNEIAKFLREEWEKVSKNNGCLSCGKGEKLAMYPVFKQYRRNFTAFARAMNNGTIACPDCYVKLKNGEIAQPAKQIEWDDSIIPPPIPPKYTKEESREIKRKHIERHTGGPALPGQ